MNSEVSVVKLLNCKCSACTGSFYGICRTNVGYPTVRDDLKKVTCFELAHEYKTNMKACFGQLFGHNARKWQNMIADELLSRGIKTVPNILKEIEISNTW